MRWSEDVTVRFVELYREHECLWNVAIPEYRDKWLKQMAYEHMVQEMGIDGFDVNEAKQKIKNLRCTYNQELMKIEKSKSLKSSTYVYVPHIKWFVIMDSFVNKIREKTMLRKYLIDKQKIKKEQPTDEEGEEILESGDIGEDGEEQYVEYLEDEIEKHEEPLIHTSNNIQKENSSDYTGDENLPGGKDSPFSFISCGLNKKRRLQETTAGEEQSQKRKESYFEEDECDAFGRYISLTLKKLPLQLSIQAQQEMQDTLTRFRLLAINSVSSNSETTSK